MHHHRGGASSGLPTAPPPPLLSSRSRGPPSRPSGRSRSPSRSRSPRGGSKYHSSAGRSERDTRDLRDRGDRERERERDRDRDRERRRSASPYNRSERDRDRDRDRESRKPVSTVATKTSSSLEALPAISLIQSENALTRSIIRNILNPEDVKIPRRVNEGSKPIFEREELREAMVRRMRANDNEENPPQSNVYIQEPTVTQQRVVAIIREPVGGDLYLASKDSSFQHHAISAKLSSSAATGLQRLSPEPSLRTYRRSASPPSRNIRQTGRLPSSPAPPPPQLPSRGRSTDRDRERERDRERIILDREREQVQRAIEREQGNRGSGRDRERERTVLPERERDLLHEIRGADRDRERERERERERDIREKSRFSGSAVSHHPLDRIESHRARSRSPISRIPREDGRMRRRSRSHSVTPPPMPEEIRRQLIERQRNIDLRNSLSRRPAKFLVEHVERSKGERSSLPTRGRGRGGGFPGRTGRGREDGRVWVHDMYEHEGDDEPKKGD